MERLRETIAQYSRWKELELVDADPTLAHHPALAAELEVFLVAADAEFLLKG